MSRLNAWYINSPKGAEGPYATDLVRAMVRNKQLKPMDLVFREGDEEWQPLSQFPELLPDATDKEMARAIRSLDAQPDFSKSNVAQSTSDGNELATPVPSEYQAWIVLRAHGSTYLQEGPFQTEQIREGLKKGAFNFGQYAWHVGMPQWMRLGDLREFDRRSAPRESTPHVPPPLPDPIAAVLLEDDGDFESEEFHVSVNPNLRSDLTPVDFADLAKLGLGSTSSVDTGSISGLTLGSPVGSGPVSEQSSFDSAPNFTATQPTGQDLAKVPWETATAPHAPVSGSAVFDEKAQLQFGQGSDQSQEAVGYSNVRRESSVESNKWENVFNETSFIPDGETAPGVRPPFMAISDVPKASRLADDRWHRTGRYISAAGFAFVSGTFVLHLLTQSNSKPGPASFEARPLVENVDQASSRDAAKAGSDVAESPQPTTGTNSESGGQVPNVSAQPNLNAMKPPMAPQTVTPIEIVGLKLEESSGSILFQGAIPVGQSIEVTFRGRPGEIVEQLKVKKTISLTRKAGEIPALALKDLDLPDGSYTVDADLGDGNVNRTDIFIGKRDADFLSRLEAHLRQNSYELQQQKKLLFYAAQELDVLARDLALNYGQLRSRPEMWTAFYKKWMAKVSAVERTVVEFEARPISQLAYPDEAEMLVGLVESLKESAEQFQAGVGAKRDVASDTLTDLIADLVRQKSAIGALTVRTPEKIESANFSQRNSQSGEKGPGIKRQDATSQGL